MKRKLLVALALALVVALTFSSVALANDPESSTLYFEGELEEGDKGYEGLIPMTIAGVYEGGFDVYAQEGGTAYVGGMDPDSWTIGADHDAYSEAGPWGSWYDPDCADWNQYSLDLDNDTWALRYTATMESPMSGTIDMDTLYAWETDPGTVKVDHGGSSTDPTEYEAGSAQEWGWWCGWGEERIPLEYPGFTTQIIDLGDGNFQVIMTPTPIPQPKEDRTLYFTADLPDGKLKVVRRGTIRYQDIDYNDGTWRIQIPANLHIWNAQAGGAAHKVTVNGSGNIISDIGLSGLGEIVITRVHSFN